MKHYLVAGLAMAIMAGCGSKNDEPKTAAPAPLAAGQDIQTSPVTPPPPPKAAADGVQRPTPGQANDHSSSEFKAGGKRDPKK